MRCLEFSAWIGFLVFVVILSILVNLAIDFLPDAIGAPIRTVFHIGVSIACFVMTLNMIATVLHLSDGRCAREGYQSFIPWPHGYAYAPVL